VILMAVTVAFLVGVIAGAPAWFLWGAITADRLKENRRRRRREQIDRDGSDAVESWFSDSQPPRPQTNGTPWPEEEVA
jgi:hypothetical protein